MGPRTEELEERFAGYVGTTHAVAVTNGTAALHLICAAAGLGPGDEVIVPSLTFVATAGAIRQAGATPVFADIVGLDRPWLAAEAAEAADRRAHQGDHEHDLRRASRARAQRCRTLAERERADSAGGRGPRTRAACQGRHLGTFGLAGAFSFFSNKNLPIGEGGMLVTDDEDLAGRAGCCAPTA